MTNRKLTLLAFSVLLLSGGWGFAAAPAREKRISPLASSLRPERRSPSPAVRAAYREFVKKHPGRWKIRYSPRTALPEALTGGRTARYPGTPEQAAISFFNDNKDLLKVEPSSLRLVLRREFMGLTHLQYQQYRDGLPVEFSYARVHVTESGEVSGYQGRVEPELPPDTVPAISEQAAIAAASAHLGTMPRVSRAELVIYPDEASGELKLAWKVRGRAGGLWVYYIDASDGSVLYRYDDLRRVCNGVSYTTRGTSSATVYAISPLPTYNHPSASLGVTEDDWTPPTVKAIRDQYFWIAGVSSTTVTTQYGDYCAAKPGKVFSSFKGPYFSVSNFRGANAHFDNGGGQWRTAGTPAATPHPYSNSESYSYSISIPDDWTASGHAFAKAMPRFSAFTAGELDSYGNVNDEDLVRVKNGSQVVGAYIGTRTSPFFGASVENTSFSVGLESDGSGTADGFSVDISSYLVLTNSPASTNNGTGSVIWSTYTAGVYLDTSLGGHNGLSEANAFYHLNAIRRYFDGVNINPDNANGPAADLSDHVPVMVHAHGQADSLTGCVGTCNGMLNAYYDLEQHHIFLGDGLSDYDRKLRSFALDGTIVRHEYIHLVIDRIYPIINFGEFGAISEGVSDFLALSSFWNEGYDGSPYPNQVTLGNFVGAGEGAARDLSGSGSPTSLRIMPADWYGEVHEDGMLISQALYKLGNPNGSRYLGSFGATGTFDGRTKAEVLVFATLFYFPDTFANFRDAMLDACSQFDTKWPGQCDAAARTAIAAAFSDHGIGVASTGDSLETSSASSFCDNNNGPECAVDISSFPALSATVYPLGDVDYYSLPLSEGKFSVKLSLPESPTRGIYHAYAMFLFDQDRQYLEEAVPAIYGTGGDACDDSGQCYTLYPSVTLNYSVPYGGGRYYLVVSGAPNQYYGNSEANSGSPYTLTLDRSPSGSATARIYAAVYDNDEIAFDVPYAYFPALGALSSATFSGAESAFEYAQLRDHNFQPVELTRTNATGSYMALSDTINQAAGNVDSLGRRLISSRVKLKPGFHSRYPGVGTVYLEVFGRNHMGHVASLGVSGALNLTANKTDVVAYNNIISPGQPARVVYEIRSPGNLSIKVYTLTGTLVKTLYSGPALAGKGSTDWDGTNSKGSKVASGIYFVKAEGPGLDKVVKVAVIR